MSFKSLRFFLCISLGALSVSLFAANNAVEMVTYFPVPYAAYNNVYVSQKFDVGANTGSFTLNLGSNCSGNTCSLKADDVTLKGVTTNSALGFNTDIYTQIAAFGDKSLAGPSVMQFDKLRIDTLNASKDHAVAEVAANNFTVRGNIYMFDDSFVTNGAALPKCDSSVTWKQLTIGGKTGYYLVCGTGESSGSGSCSESTYFLNHKSECCSERSVQDDIRTIESIDEMNWNYESQFLCYVGETDIGGILGMDTRAAPDGYIYNDKTEGYRLARCPEDYEEGAIAAIRAGTHEFYEKNDYESKRCLATIASDFARLNPEKDLEAEFAKAMLPVNSSYYPTACWMSDGGGDGVAIAARCKAVKNGW